MCIHVIKYEFLVADSANEWLYYDDDFNDGDDDDVCIHVIKNMPISGSRQPAKIMNDDDDDYYNDDNDDDACINIT